MYQLRSMADFPDVPKTEFMLSYECDLDGDNHEWRQCVEDMLSKLRRHYSVEPILVPAFVPKEDFLELHYSLGEGEISFSSDFLFSTIWVTASSEQLAAEVRQFLAKELGAVGCT
jgi:hypothetical protein